MIQVTRKDSKESTENMLRRFTRKVQQSGVIAVAKQSQRYEKPMSKRDRREKAIVRRERKAVKVKKLKLSQMIKQAIDTDIKSAMLSGDKRLVEVLRTIKSSILDVEVNTGKREEGLDEETVITILQKESKKRSEAAELYAKAGDNERAAKEKYEVEVLQKYLPEMMGVDQITEIVSQVIATTPDASMQKMGQIIGQVKAKTGAQADGAVIARIVKEKLTN